MSRGYGIVTKGVELGEVHGHHLHSGEFLVGGEGPCIAISYSRQTNYSSMQISGNPLKIMLKYSMGIRNKDHIGDIFRTSAVCLDCREVCPFSECS
jgi:hypothetical protein